MTHAPRRPPTDTYDPAFFTQLFAIEDRHFWFRPATGSSARWWTN